MVLKKRFMAVLLVMVFAFSALLAGCKKGDDTATDSTTEETVKEETTIDEGTTDETAEAETEADSAATSGDAYSMYIAAAEAMQKVEGYEADMTTKSSSDFNGDVTESETTAHIIVKYSGDAIEMKSVSTTATSGINVETTMWLSDGMAYMESAGQKVKMSMDLSQITNSATNTVEFPKEAIINENVTDVDGGKKIEFTIKGEAMSEYAMSQMSSLGSDSSKIDFSDSKITAVIDSKGNMTECTTETTFSMDLGDSEYKGTTITEMKNIKFGSVDIGLPTDLDSYQDLSSLLQSTTTSE
ncbi:MAG: hypothetical protein LBQ95_00730 [Lachnospiraceae bacterium]|nr:hypothetical protein [Lachnospiraceae bacterium]